nr:hypothetical protein [Halieaceae bacterium]
MSKAVKIVLGAVVALVAVVSIAMLMVLQNLDAIIKQVIEDVGSEVVGTPVRVSVVNFNLQQGRGEILGLRIANPPGFDSANAFEMDEVAVQVRPTSLAGAVDQHLFYDDHRAGQGGRPDLYRHLVHLKGIGGVEARRVGYA